MAYDHSVTTDAINRLRFISEAQKDRRPREEDLNDLQKNTGESQKTNCLLSQYLTNSNPWTHGICRKDTLKDKRAFPLN